MNWTLIIIAVILGIILGLFIMLRRESKKAVINLSEKEFVENMRKGQLVDLRKKEEFDQGHIFKKWIGSVEVMTIIFLTW